MSLRVIRFASAKPSGPSRGFTLIELLVVIALVAGLAAFLVGSGVAGGSKAAALQSAQSTLANLVTAARLRAQASGCRVRLLICADTASSERFRRYIALQQESGYKSNSWPTTADVVFLPQGILVLPYKDRIPTGLYANQAEWTKGSSSAYTDNELHSSSLSGAVQPAVISSTNSVDWDVIQFTPNGTMTTGTGDLVIATCSMKAPGSFASGEAPVLAESPDLVRGLSISTYGVPMLINGRNSF